MHKFVKRFINGYNGFTLVEVIIVLILMGILSMVALAKMGNLSTDLLSISSALQSHIRYTQAQAMQSETGVWGIRLDASDDKYWIFNCEIDQTCNVGNNPILPPGTETNHDNKIDTGLKGVDIQTSVTLVFDQFGIPFESDETSLSFQDPLDGTTNLDKLTTSLEINLEDNSEAKKRITVEPETGFVQ